MRENKNFSITRLRYLADDGQLLAPLPEWLGTDTLVRACEIMTLTRLFDSKAIALQRTGKLGTYPSMLGQEAISTAIGLTMHPDDVLAPYYRDVSAQLLRGVTMEEILTYWGGDERGSDYASCPRDLPICVPIATQLGHAAGAAAAQKIRGLKAATVATLGDGATSKGDFLESLNCAGAWQLPLVIVINNNQWAISVPRALQCHASTLAQKAIGAGIPGLEVDGNDIVGLLVALRESLQRARSGKGATLIEALTYRLCDHTTADDASRYRPDTELEKARQREPLKRLKQWLRTEGLWSDEREQDCESRCRAQIDAAVQAYRKRPKEAATAMFDHLYAELPATYLEQYRDLATRYPAQQHAGGGEV